MLRYRGVSFIAPPKRLQLSQQGQPHGSDVRRGRRRTEGTRQPGTPPAKCHLLLDRFNIFTKHKTAAKRVEQGKERRTTLENMLEQHPTMYFSKARKSREPGGE